MAITSLGANDTGATSCTVINDNFTDLDTTKADLASPALTGNPTAPTQSASDNSTKLATTAYVDTAISAATTVSVETTAAATHSLTTTAGQVVVVWAKGNTTTTGNKTLTLKYGGVTKDTITTEQINAGEEEPFALMYTETPGAATADVTIEGDTIGNPVIIVMKIG